MSVSVPGIWYLYLCECFWIFIWQVVSNVDCWMQSAFIVRRWLLTFIIVHASISYCRFNAFQYIPYACIHIHLCVCWLVGSGGGGGAYVCVLSYWNNKLKRYLWRCCRGGWKKERKIKCNIWSYFTPACITLCLFSINQFQGKQHIQSWFDDHFH